jgi:hypothetical protein
MATTFSAGVSALMSWLEARMNPPPAPSVEMRSRTAVRTSSGVPNRRMYVHVVAAVAGLQMFAAYAPVVLEHAVPKNLRRRADVPRLQPANVDLQSPQQVLMAIDLQVLHHVAVHFGFGLGVGGRTVGTLSLGGGQYALARSHGVLHFIGLVFIRRQPLA